MTKRHCQPPCLLALAALLAAACLPAAAQATPPKPPARPAPPAAPIIGDPTLKPGPPRAPHALRELAGILGGDLEARTAAGLESTLAAYQGAGCSFVRVRIDWSRVQPQLGPYQWREADQVVNLALGKGLGVVAVLGCTPLWASRGDRQYEARERQCMVARDPRYWRAFVTSAVRHFKDRVRYWQVWEQPVIQNFRGTRGDYLALVQGASEAARAEDASCRLMVPEHGGIDLAAVDAAQGKPEWGRYHILGLAPASRQASELVRPLATLERLLAEGPGKELWISEWQVPRTGAELAEAAKSLTVARALGVSRAIMRLVPNPAGEAEGDPQAALAPVAAACGGAYQGFFQAGGATAYAFGQGEQMRVVAWREGEAAAPLHLCAAPVQGAAILCPAGTIVTVSKGGEAASLTVGEEPAAVEIGPEPMVLAVPAALECFQQEGQPRRPAPVVDERWAKAEAVSAGMQDTQWVEQGLYNERLRGRPGGKMRLAWSGWRWALMTNISDVDAEDNAWYYFDVDDSFLYFDRGRTRVEVTVEVQGSFNPGTLGFNIFYDSTTGYRFSPWHAVGMAPDWYQFATVLEDVNFANRAGYDFRVSATGSRDNMFLGSVVVRKLPAEGAPTATPAEGAPAATPAEGTPAPPPAEQAPTPPPG